MQSHVVEQYIRESFGDDRAVVEKCLKIIALHRISFENFLAEWESYTLTSNTLIKPTVDSLTRFEDEILSIQASVNQDHYEEHEPVNLQDFDEPAAIPIDSTNLFFTTNILESSDKAAITQILPPWNTNVFLDGFKWMENKFEEMESLIAHRLGAISKIIMRDRNLKVESPNFAAISPTPTTAVGFIVPEDGIKITASNVHLQNGTISMPLDLIELREISLFPGQVVVVRGINPYGTRFIAQSIHSNASVHMQRAYELVPVDHLRSKKLHVIVAFGPFTLQSNFEFQPLKTLLEHVLSANPDVLILCGPFIDYEHSLLRETQVLYEKILTKHLWNPLRELQFKLPKISIVIQPSHRDILYPPIIPQPAISLSNTNSLLMVPNPTLLAINDIHFGFTSADVLKELYETGFELKNFNGKTSIETLVTHILHQRSFVPQFQLFPVHFEHARVGLEISHLPDVLLFGSDLKEFQVNVDGVLAVNLGKLVFGDTLGSYLELKISDSSDPSANSLSTRTSAQIVKMKA